MSDNTATLHNRYKRGPLKFALRVRRTRRRRPERERDIGERERFAGRRPGWPISSAQRPRLVTVEHWQHLQQRIKRAGAEEEVRRAMPVAAANASPTTQEKGQALLPVDKLAWC